jgi:hypothetical protein
VALPTTPGTPWVFNGSFGSAGASAFTVTLNANVSQFANPWLVITSGEKAPQSAACALLGFCTHQFTGRGVTVKGGALNVPVATNCTWPFAVCGLTDIDCSIRELELAPQLNIKREASRSAKARETRTRMLFILHLLEHIQPD